MDYQPIESHVTFFALFFIIFGLLFTLAALAFFTFLYCRIFKKTGFHWSLGLLYLVPAVNLFIIPLILAFAPWPVNQRLKELENRDDTAGQNHPPQEI